MSAPSLRRALFASLTVMLVGGCEKMNSGDRQSNPQSKSAVAQPAVFAEYQSTASDWTAFLGCWRDQVQARLAAGRSYGGPKRLPDEVNQAVKSPDAERVGKEIAQAESRLGLTLPKSYQDFVIARADTGWLIESMANLGDGVTMLPLRGIGSYSAVDQANLKIWMSSGAADTPIEPRRYFRYGYQANAELRQDPAYFSLSQLPGLIVIGKFASGGAMLLNPKMLSAEGEMEAWTLDFKSYAWLYRSFAEMMQNLAYFDVMLDAAKVPFNDPGALKEVPCTGLLRTAAR